MNDQKSEKLSFELLMEKFQFHNTSIHFHAELAKRIGEKIRDEYTAEAKATGYFTDEFFEQSENADSLSANTNNDGDQPSTDIEADHSAEIKEASDSALSLH